MYWFALRIEGVGNSFCSKIVEIQEDELFARIILESHLAKNGNITALVSLDFINQNALKIGSEVFWHISEMKLCCWEWVDGFCSDNASNFQSFYFDYFFAFINCHTLGLFFGV